LEGLFPEPGFHSHSLIFPNFSNKETKNNVVGIIVQEHEPIDRALRRFKKKYERAGILKEYRRRTAFEKPSVTNKMLRQRAARRQLRIQEETA